MSFSYWSGTIRPVAERVRLIVVRAWFRPDAVITCPDIATLFATAGEMIEVPYGAVAYPSPASVEKLVDKNAASPPHCPAWKARRVLAVEVVTRAFINGRPMKLVWYGVDFL